MKAKTAKKRTENVAQLHSPNTAQYGGLDLAFYFFNYKLWSGALPHCLITLNRKANSRGYFRRDGFTERGTKAETATLHEIALNPDCITGRTDTEVYSTLVHEMAHLWQQTFGTPGRGAYHNAEWAEEMLRIGLQPISMTTDKGTGQRVTHEIISGGAFAKYCKALIDSGHSIKYGSTVYEEGEKEKAKKKSSKTKYTCPGCEANAWAKPESNLICGDCELQLVENEA